MTADEQAQAPDTSVSGRVVLGVRADRGSYLCAPPEVNAARVMTQAARVGGGADVRPS